MGCPIRKSRGQRSFAPNPGLSQLITSFIASVSQGIRHAPLFTFANDCTIDVILDYFVRRTCALWTTIALSLILSAVDSSNLQSCLCQYVKDLLRTTRHHRLSFCVEVRIGFAYPVLIVENNGFEPLTPCLQSRCSSQLS